VWLPPAGRFQAWISLHPRLFGHSDLGPVHVEVGVTSGTTYTRVGGLDLDATDPTQRAYGPVDLPLPSVDGARADLSITVRQDTGSSLPAEVLVGEPRVVLP
jgi:hypothetical protein